MDEVPEFCNKKNEWWLAEIKGLYCHSFSSNGVIWLAQQRGLGMSIDREVVGHFHRSARKDVLYFSVVISDEAISNQQILAKLAICDLLLNRRRLLSTWIAKFKNLFKRIRAYLPMKGFLPILVAINLALLYSQEVVSLLSNLEISSAPVGIHCSSFFFSYWNAFFRSISYSQIQSLFLIRIQPHYQ